MSQVIRANLPTASPDLITRIAGIKPIVDLRVTDGRLVDVMTGASSIIFSRPSSAYRINLDNTLTLVGNDVLRTTQSELYVEPERENRLNFSSSLETSGGTNNNWVYTDMTRVSTTELAPDGTSTATLIEGTSANATVISDTADGSGDYVFSGYLKRGSGSGQIQYTINNGSTWSNINPTSEWARYRFISQNVTSAHVGFKINASGSQLYVWGLMLERARNVTTPIITTTARVTRSADILYLDNIAGLRKSLPPQGTFVVISRFQTADQMSYRRICTLKNTGPTEEFSLGTTTNRTGMTVEVNNSIVINATAFGPNFSAGNETISAGSFGLPRANAASRISSMATARAGFSVLTPSGNMGISGQPTKLSIGVDGDNDLTTSRGLFIKRILLYPKHLSQAQVRDICETGRL
jgi:hypothetical protein